MAFIKKAFKEENKQISLNRYSQQVFVVILEKEENYKTNEKARIAGNNLLSALNKKKLTGATVLGQSKKLLPFLEGMALGNYQFLKYMSDKKKNSCKSVKVLSSITAKQLAELDGVVKAIYHTRDLVNEPLSFLNAVQIAKEIKKLGKEAGFKVEVMGKTKIEALKMGGLLAVNKGSVDPPTFSVMEWKPKNAKNKKTHCFSR